MATAELEANGKSTSFQEITVRLSVVTPGGNLLLDQVEALKSSTLGELVKPSQEDGKFITWLISPSGALLQKICTIEEACLQDSDIITAVLGLPSDVREAMETIDVGGPAAAVVDAVNALVRHSNSISEYDRDILYVIVIGIIASTLNNSPWVQVQAMKALHNIGAPAVPLLTTMLKDPKISAARRAAAAHALGFRQAPASKELKVQALCEALQDLHWLVRDAAKQSLEVLLGKQVAAVAMNSEDWKAVESAQQQYQAIIHPEPDRTTFNALVPIHPEPDRSAYERRDCYALCIIQ